MPETFTSATNGPDDDAPFRSRLSFDLDVDICVVGAGLAGLTVALEAARLGASVAVLEGRHVGWNASGHQLGTVMPGYSLPIGDLIERVGLEDARELWAMSKKGADYVRAAATEEAMPGIALTEGALEVSTVDAGETLISRLQTLSEDFETEVEGWQLDRVRGELGTARYFHGIYYPRAFQIDGRKYIHGLAAQARRAGAAPPLWTRYPAPHCHHLSPTRQGRDIRRVRRRGRGDRARHAADRPVAQRAVGRQRLRPPWSEHLGNGGAGDCAQHPVGRGAVETVLAVRT